MHDSAIAAAASTSDERLREIYDTAAKLFHTQGYAKTSMSDVARALNLTKAGLYHHIRSKELLLYGVINYGLDLLEEQVVEAMHPLREPAVRLRCLIRAHIQLILQSRFREITVILHENRTLKGTMRAQVDARKKRYIQLLEDLLEELRRQRPEAGVSPRVGAFALLGMINWLYQWYRPTGAIPQDELADQFTRLFLNGYLGVEHDSQAPLPLRRHRK
jgi:TetR/AcrR family transcriptional regulator, cholesterol catabolism regulator